jgi:hypothetical protein
VRHLCFAGFAFRHYSAAEPIGPLDSSLETITYENDMRNHVTVVDAPMRSSGSREEVKEIPDFDERTRRLRPRGRLRILARIYWPCRLLR